MKKTLLVMCLLVLFSGVAQAGIVSEVDSFDKTKYIYSYFRLPDIKDKGLEIKNLIFRKRITADNVEYMLMFANARDGSPVYNAFLVKFDNNDNEIYNLPRKGDDIVLTVPENVVNKILSSNKITLRIPIDPEYSKTSINNIVVDIRADIISEWRQVIQAQ